MIATACGRERRCGRPSNSYLNCVAQSLDSIAWGAHRALVKQHMNALVYFADEPDLLPSGPHLSEALPQFKADVLQVAETLRTAAASSHGALDMPLKELGAPIRLATALEEFLVAIDDNVLPMSITFFEDGDLSLYGPTLQEKVVTRKKATCRPVRGLGFTLCKVDSVREPQHLLKGCCGKKKNIPF